MFFFSAVEEPMSVGKAANEMKLYEVWQPAAIALLLFSSPKLWCGCLVLVSFGATVIRDLPGRDGKKRGFYFRIARLADKTHSALAQPAAPNRNFPLCWVKAGLVSVPGGLPGMENDWS